MFTIKPAVPEDYYEIKDLFDEKGVPFNLTGNMGIMVAREDGFAGIGVYVMGDGCAEFTHLLMKDDDNFQMKFFICKAVLNAIDLKGVQNVTASLPGEEKVLKMCKFKEENGKFSIDLTGYFEAGCHCC